MHEIICECIYKFNSVSYDDCKQMLDDLQFKLRVGLGIDTIKCVKYAQYDYSLLLYDIGDVKSSIENYKKVLSLYDEYGIKQDSPWRNTTYTNYADSLILNNQYENAIY